MRWRPTGSWCWWGPATALAARWSPDTERDVSGEQLTALRRNPQAFLFDLTRQDGTIVTASGREVRRLPSRVFWLDDGQFCGIINLRFMTGTDTRLTDGSGAADFLGQGSCRFALVESRSERAFVQRAEAIGLRYNVATRVEGYNISQGKAVSIAIFRSEGTE